MCVCVCVCVCVLEGGDLLKETLPPPTESTLWGITAGRRLSDLPFSLHFVPQGWMQNSLIMACGVTEKSGPRPN